MDILIDILGCLYLLIIFVSTLYGFNSLFMTILYLRNKVVAVAGEKLIPPKRWPAVTIQLPIYNEKYTVERLLAAVTKLDYPSELLHIQVLDDSIDDTVQLVDKLVAEYKSKGLNVVNLHRT